MTTRCGTRSWAWGARPPSPHGPWGLLWLAAPYRHLARDKVRQVSVHPGAHPESQAGSVGGKVTCRSWKGSSGGSEAAGRNLTCVCVKAPASPFPPLKLALPFPAETVSQTRIHVKRHMSQSALFLQQEATRRPTRLGPGQCGWQTLTGRRSWASAHALSTLWGRECVCRGASMLLVAH